MITMAIKYMRIVAINPDSVFIQTATRNTHNFTQTIITRDEFANLMMDEFPEYWADYEKCTIPMDAADFFYHYGETPEMRKTGEAYIYTN